LVLSVRRQGGIVIECSGQGVVFDPVSDSIGYPTFISHAHSDHASAFKYPINERYSTEPTQKLVGALIGRTVGSVHPMSIGGKVRVGEMEIISHNAGHVLGSVEFEVATPEGVILYTGDFSLGDSYTMKPAEHVKCDMLVIETTFGSPIFSFPKRQKIALDMVRWATMEAIPEGKIPTLRTDSIGNAQEIIMIFNRMTKLPVVTCKGVTKASDIYRQYGYGLDYVEAESEEGIELLESGARSLSSRSTEGASQRISRDM
jgi:Cft2 family RNA processing exonuclease